jgi:hypothetical protein
MWCSLSTFFIFVEWFRLQCRCLGMASSSTAWTLDESDDDNIDNRSGISPELKSSWELSDGESVTGDPAVILTCAESPHRSAQIRHQSRFRSRSRVSDALSHIPATPPPKIPQSRPTPQKTVPVAFPTLRWWQEPLQTASCAERALRGVPLRALRHASLFSGIGSDMLAMQATVEVVSASVASYVSCIHLSCDVRYMHTHSRLLVLD